MEKRGSKSDHTEAAHINSYEVLNTVLKHKSGPYYSENTVNSIRREMDRGSNLRIKSEAGNHYGSNGYSGDMYYDKMIIGSLNATNPKEKVITNQGAVDRVSRIWESVRDSDLPIGLKHSYRSQLSEIRDQHGHKIIRSNASLN